MKKEIKLLLVNDNEYAHTMLKRLAQNSKIAFSFDHAYNGKEAVDKIKLGNSYDAILMNIEMPLMNGLFATRKIRELGYAKPILAWSAHFRFFMWEACQKAGMDEYIDTWGTDMLEDVIVGLIKCKVITL